MITVFHMNPKTWEKSIKYRRTSGGLAAFHVLSETKEGMVKVAEVDTNDLNVAYELTNTIDRYWIENDGVKVFNGNQHRSTDVGDLFYKEEDGVIRIWVVASCGFEELITPEPYVHPEDIDCVHGMKWYLCPTCKVTLAQPLEEE